MSIYNSRDYNSYTNRKKEGSSVPMIIQIKILITVALYSK